jgi:uncharacterized UPF0160 family protein
MRAATHDGSFHADDVFAIAVLRMVTPDLEVVRSRDADVLSGSDVRVDVGLRDDPEAGDFDHHQKGGAGERANGIPYASFGLVWRLHGAALCGRDELAAAEVDARLVQGVDAIDTGFTLSRPVIDGVRSADVSDLVDQFNPDWDDDASDTERLERFERAVAFAGDILERSIAGALAGARARGLVAEAIAAAADPRVIELDRAMPWAQAVVAGAPDALFVLYPKKADDWRMQTVPQRLGDFANRRDLPAAWAGLQGEELAALTGVQDARFCHNARFLATARSQAGIRELARQALADGNG